MFIKLSSDSRRSNKIRYSFISKKCGFGNLSSDILLNIFKHLDEEELKNNIIPVCQNWKYAAENPALWKSLVFSGKQIETSKICDKVWQYSNAKRVHLKNVLEPVVVLRQVSRCSENLQHLILRYCVDVSEDALRHLIFTCKTLKTLDLKGTPLKSLILYEELACAKNLTGINLSENPHLTRSNILTVAVNCRSLDELHLSTFNPTNRVFLTDSDCYFIVASLVHDLKILSLDCSTLNSYSFSFILRCKHLRCLCLNYAYNFEGSIFENMWKDLPNLSSLKVRYGHQITDLNVKNFFENGVGVLEKLLVIDFTGCCKINNVGIRAIANCCKKLRTLVLRGCKNVTDISCVLKECKLLELLNIAFCENLTFNELVIPKRLKLLFISDNNGLKMFADLVKENNGTTRIRKCVSEFNKRVINYE